MAVTTTLEEEKERVKEEGLDASNIKTKYNKINKPPESTKEIKSKKRI